MRKFGWSWSESFLAKLGLVRRKATTGKKRRAGAQRSLVFEPLEPRELLAYDPTNIQWIVDDAVRCSEGIGEELIIPITLDCQLQSDDDFRELVDVHYRVPLSGGDPPGPYTATPDQDYDAISLGEFSFWPTDSFTAQDFEVSILEDDLIENSETFTLEYWWELYKWDTLLGRQATGVTGTGFVEITIDDNDRLMPEPTESNRCGCPSGDGAGGGVGGGDASTQNNNFGFNTFTGSGGCAQANCNVSGGMMTYSNQAAAGKSDEGVGVGWSLDSRPYVAVSDTRVAIVYNAANAHWFESSGGTFTSLNGSQQKLTHDTTNHVYRLTSTEGSVTEFHDFEQTSYPSGLFKSSRSAGGITTTASYDAAGRVETIEETIGTTVNGQSYVYVDGRLSTATLYKREGQGANQELRRASYEYYTSDTDPNGSVGDLKRVTVQFTNGIQWSDGDTFYFRYYKEWEQDGFAHALKRVILPNAYQSLYAATNGDLSKAVEGTPGEGEVAIANYTCYYYKYNSTTHRISYQSNYGGSNEYSNTFFSRVGEQGYSDGYNTWQRAATELRPDGTQHTVYANFAGQTVMTDLQNGTDRWVTLNVYDSAGLLTTAFESSAVSGVTLRSDGYIEAVTLKSGEGVCRYYQYYDGADGTPAGYLKLEGMRQGSEGTAIKRHEYLYKSAHVDKYGQTTYAIDKVREYKDETNYIETSFSYTYYQDGGQDLSQVKERTVTLPVVSIGQNGSGSTTVTRKVYFDLQGRLVWSKDERGFLTHTEYDAATGAVTRVLQDVNTALVDDEPIGWATPTGGGAHLITDYEVDGVGRTILVYNPEFQNEQGQWVRTASWTGYLDAQNETRRAQGYVVLDGRGGTVTSSVVVGSVSIEKYDPDGRLLESIEATTGTWFNRAGFLVGTASPVYEDYCRWTVNVYSTTRLARTAVYFNIPHDDTTKNADKFYGEAGENYDVTRYEYDTSGRLFKTTSPSGTITCVVFDGRGNVWKTYVGTDATGWSPSTPTAGNMRLASENVYDGGQDGGDGLLTESRAYTGDATFQSTQYGYTWRNELEWSLVDDGTYKTYTKQTYDRLGRVTQRDQYHDFTGEGVDPEGDPTPDDILIGRTKTYYDDRGRVYQTQQYSVDPATGTVGAYPLVSKSWYDEAGNVIKSHAAGSSVAQKTVYDGLGRVSVQYVCTPLSDSTYAQQGAVADDLVFEQTEYTYGAAGNVVVVASRQRYHDALTSQTGPLQGPKATSGPKSRDSYVAYAYDGMGRQVEAINYGAIDATNLLGQYARQQTITIDHAHVDANLTNFPLLVKFTDDAEIGAHTRPDGYDIRFTDASGTELKYEREFFGKDDGAASGVFWVKVPTIYGDKDTTIYMYYGNPGATDGEDAESVWDGNYQGVWHFGDGSSLDLHDSTGNERDATAFGNPSATARSSVDGGVYFDGVDDYLSLPVSSSNLLTIEYVGEFGSDLFGVTFYSSTSGYGSGGTPQGIVTSSSMQLLSCLNDWMAFSTPLTGLSGTDHYYSYALDKTYQQAAAMYFDGVLVETDPNYSHTPGFIADDQAFINHVWYPLPGYDWYASGKIYEVRLSDTMRSEAWMKFQSHNMSETDNALSFSGGLVSRVEYNARGDVEFTVDPNGRRDKTVYDDAGRVVATIQNYTGDGVAKWHLPAENVTILTTYTPDGQVATYTAVNPIRGDLNFDGAVNVSDIDLLQAAMRAPSTDPLYDLDGDGVADYDDLLVLVDILGTSIGDANLDGAVTVADGTIISAYLGQAGGWSQGDFNGDGDVTVADWSLYSANFGFSGTLNVLSPYQTTIYVYGWLNGDNGLRRMDTLAGVIYPDSDDEYTVSSAGQVTFTDGSDDTFDHVEYTYDRMGRQVTFQDQNQTVHWYDYDGVGRLLHDRVVSYDFQLTSFDASSRRISRSYDVRGLPEHVTSYANEAVGQGTAANDLYYVYNDFGQLTSEYQKHDGLINAANLAATPRIQYVYANGSSNHVRLTSVVYPSGRTIGYTYDANSGALSAITESGSAVAQYSHLGLGTLVKTVYPTPGVQRTLFGDSAEGAGYGGLDQYGRVVDLTWEKTSNGADLDRYRYGYDPSGNRLWKENVVSGNLGTPVHLDELYDYDDMYQLIASKRGNLVDEPSGKDIVNAAFAQDWNLDATGNWTGFGVDTDEDGAIDTNQAREHNAANEIASIDGSSAGIAYDDAGNMTRMPKPGEPATVYDVKYDAWNRMTRVANHDSAAPVAAYEYDGTNRRIVKQAFDAAGAHVATTTDVFYNANWQVLEEREVAGTEAFDVDGKRSLSTSAGREDLSAVMVLANGKTLMAGNSQNTILVMRFNADGSLDTTFGEGDGIVQTACGVSSYGQAIGVQLNGNIVVAGYVNLGSSIDFVLVRYTPDGVLDDDYFGDAGVVTTNFGGDDRAFAMVILSDDRILVAGQTTASGNADFALARYSPDGELDTANFGIDGKVTTDFAGGADVANAMAIQSGNIILAGYATVSGNRDFALARYFADGDLDTANFGIDGIMTTDIRGTGASDSACGVVVQSDNSIFLGGSASGDFTFVRYTADGQLDTTSGFGNNGKVVVPMGVTPSSLNVPYALLQQSDGKLVLGGRARLSTLNVNPLGFALVRVNTDGTADSTFGEQGIVLTDMGYFWAFGRGLAIQPDGKLTLVGYGSTGLVYDLIIARYTAEGKLDGTEVTEYVWNGEYVDSLAMRLRDSNGDGDVADDGERLYLGSDANYNITMLVGLESGVWDARERYTYDAYGVPTYLNANFMELAVQESAYDNTTLYTGRELAPETGLMYYRARYYHTDLGRFTARDPIGYEGGINVYGYCGDNPIDSVDPSGLYDIDFHYYAIYYLLRAKCWVPYWANEVAGWSQYIDENDKTEALWCTAETRAKYHFPGSSSDTSTCRDDAGARTALIAAISEYEQGGIGTGVRLGVQLHVYADSWGHEGFTAWHSDESNTRTGSMRPNTGHADAPEGGHAPDYPYLDTDKALDAARRLYMLIPARQCDCTPLPWSTVEQDLTAAFNSGRNRRLGPKASEEEKREWRVRMIKSIIRDRFGELPCYKAESFADRAQAFEDALGIR